MPVWEREKTQKMLYDVKKNRDAENGATQFFSRSFEKLIRPLLAPAGSRKVTSTGKICVYPKASTIYANK